MKDGLLEMERVVAGRLWFFGPELQWTAYSPETLTKSLLTMRHALKRQRERAEKAEAKLEAVRKLVLVVADLEGWNGICKECNGDCTYVTGGNDNALCKDKT